MSYLSRISLGSRHFLNWGVTIASVILCILILPTRLPGMELLGIGPNWPLIWVVAWSIRRKRTLMEAIIGSMALGFLQDAMTAPHPTHAVSLVVVGVLTIVLQKMRSIPPEIIEKDPIPIALIVFGMAMVAETVMALQFSWIGEKSSLGDIWSYHQRVALCSAILSSLWAPVLYFPLNRLWDMTSSLES
ncbi:rod shape-determining protein MreD [Kamptonema sp. UHCC 0994]|uniref:rod shape-determining protein MreD n=1 Tax=Kamptonema sp. UHCC 0994 TaxID=3031329 RepID=UPI0023B96E90|nr:rod shape-determining protein MreD [Kamptonema sp. UHCC 0994]MDF0551731.1 rod shape-determining protein MreD [Kamptonema sp. UHCC 0994]